MATQTIPTFEQAINPAVTPAMRRKLTTNLTLGPNPRAAHARRAARKAQEQQRLLVEMLPLVRRVAFKIREHLPAHVDVDDLVANGVVGLVNAVSKFDSSKRVKIESYARHRIQGGILEGCAARILPPVTYGARTSRSRSSIASSR